MPETATEMPTGPSAQPRATRTLPAESETRPFAPDGTGDDWIAVAAAMVRHALCYGHSGQSFMATWTSDGIWLHVTWRTPEAASPGLEFQDDPGALALIEFLVARFGACGDQDRHTLWALLPATQAALGSASDLARG
jgi:hypothetical protein